MTLAWADCMSCFNHVFLLDICNLGERIDGLMERLFFGGGFDILRVPCRLDETHLST